MKILFVLENYWPHIGGVENVFKNLSENLAKKGHEINIVTHRLKNTKTFETVNKVKIHRIDSFDSRYWFTFLSIPKVLELAKNADIIHTTTYNGAFPAKIASEIRKKPCLITVHEVLGRHWKELEGMGFFSASLHKFLEKRILSMKFDKYVSVSRSTEKDVLQSIPKQKSTVIYNGVDYALFNPKKYSGKKVRKKLGLKNFTYMAYGRPGISKGMEYLVRSVPLIKKKIPKSKLILVLSKDKAYRKKYNYLVRLMEKLNIRKDVILLPPLPLKDLIEHIMASDCIVVPSLTEGFGYTAAESCALGKPVVASNTTSLPEIISGKYILVKPKSPEAIAVGVEMVQKKKYKKSKLKKFTWDRAVNSYLKVYKEILK